ncbi:MAG: FAD-dependent oxidoreductase [Clostridiales Family XIII bacterium]|jgi:thioredoxin reductase (NADPH)|nr:FAD-dependent oxidoreductase [Clostridiales Family XIII bacterium]
MAGFCGCGGTAEADAVIYDVAIVGGGPAGLSAALYARRAARTALVIEKSRAGGQLGATAAIENYPGVMRESGEALAGRMAEQCAGFGADFAEGCVTEYALRGDVKALRTAEAEFLAKTVIIASGRRPLPLGARGEAEFVGRGISYCATCDGPMFSGLDVYVAGGGDSAVEEAMYLTKFARKVTLVHRRDSLRAARTLQERAFANEKLSFVWDSVIREACGGDVLDGLVIENLKTGAISEVRADDGMMGLFIFIGLLPNTEGLDGLVELDKGHIVTDEEMRTNLAGVFAAGDVRRKPLRQVVTAVADGAIAAMQADRHICGLGDVT